MGGGFANYYYDGLGRLRGTEYFDGMSVLISTPMCMYDGFRVIQERNYPYTPTVSYTRGTDLSGSLEGAGGIGGMLARSHGYSGGNWSTHNYYHADGNGNITYLIDGSQSMTASYRYDPYGTMTDLSGALAGANTYRFSSKMGDDFTGFYYYGYRWYSPYWQRWMNRDPIEEEGGINLYEFVKNNPIDVNDPLGKDTNTHPPKIIYEQSESEMAREALIIARDLEMQQIVESFQSNWFCRPFSPLHHASADASKTQGGENNTGNGLPANTSSSCSKDEIGNVMGLKNSTMTCKDGKTVVQCMAYQKCEPNRMGRGQSWTPHKRCGKCPDGSQEKY